nr:MAG TPA: hypothetical protein [Bacteriophage sp.]
MNKKRPVYNNTISISPYFYSFPPLSLSFPFG